MIEAHGHKDCYGTMLPEVTIEPRMAGAGKVFSFLITHPGGLGPPLRHINVDRRQWDDCCSCPEFDHCYKFSMMKIGCSILVSQG